MTDDEYRETFALIRHHASPAVHELINSVERMWTNDRLMIDVLRAQVALADGVMGHRVYQDNERHSRRASDLRSVS